MTESYLLAIDQGTTNTKVIIVNSLGQDVAQASRPVNITFPKPAWVEQDALQIWQSVRAALDDCLTKAKVPIAAIGISNQRESVLLWERSTGKPLGPVISWQCRRSAEFCAVSHHTRCRYDAVTQNHTTYASRPDYHRGMSWR